jgi:hypothetical protein
MMPHPLRRSRNVISTAAPVAPDKRGIPFDYAFRYELKGRRGNVINSVVTVSIEATFTAVSIGYGVVPKVQPIVFGLPAPDVAGTKRDFLAVTLREVLTSLTTDLAATTRTLRGETGPEGVFRNGFKLNPEVAELALQAVNTTRPGAPALLPQGVSERLFQVVGSPPELAQFKYAIFDEGSGREFQSEPILNIAGLGSAGGERPFRYFAQPITFRPRSTIRMEITEESDFTGQLHVSLHGYKELGGADSPTGMAQRRARGRRR